MILSRLAALGRPFFLSLLGLWACQAAGPSPEEQAKLVRLGEQIRQARLASGLSQRDLAEAAELNQDNLSLIEDGLASPTPAKIIRLQEILGVELVWK